MASRDGADGHFGAHSGAASSVAAAGAAAAIAAAASSQALPTPSPSTGAHPLLTDVVLPTAAFVPATVMRGQLIVKTTTRDSAPDVQWLAPFIQSALLEGRTRVLVRSESSKPSSWVVDLVTWCVWQADGDGDGEGDHVDVLNPRTAVHALSVMVVHNQMDNVTPGAAGAADGRKVEEVSTATTTSGVSHAPPPKLSPLLQRFDGTAQLWIWGRQGISFCWQRVDRDVQRIMVLCMWQALHGLFASTPSHRYRSKSSQQDAMKYKWLLCPSPFCVVDTTRQLVCPARLTHTTPHKGPSASAGTGAGAGAGAGATATAAQIFAPSLPLPPTVLLETPQNVMAYMPPPWAGHMQKTWPLLSSEAWCNRTAAMVHDRFLPQCVRFNPTRGFVKHHPPLNARGTNAFRPLSTAAAEWPTQLYHRSVADEVVRLVALQRSVRQTARLPNKSQWAPVLIPNASLQRLPHLVRTPDRPDGLSHVARIMARTVEPSAPGDHEVLSRIVQYLVTSLHTARPLHVMELHVPESAAAVRATRAVRAAQLATTRAYVHTLQQLLNPQEKVLPLVVEEILVWLNTFVDLGSEMRDSGNTVMLWHCTSPHAPLEMVATRRGPSIAESHQGHRAVWDNGIHAFTAAYVHNMFGSYAVPPERCGGRANVKQMLLVPAGLGCPANAEWPAGTRGRGAYARATLRAYVRDHCAQTHSAADVTRMEEAIDRLVFHATLSVVSRTGRDVSTFGIGHHAILHRDNAVTPSFLVTYEEQPDVARAKPQDGAHTRKRKAGVLAP